MFKRLHDWWTRPSWDDYLAEQQAAVNAMTLADDLNDRLKFNVNINSDLLVKLIEAKDSLHTMGVNSIRQSEYEEENRLRIAAEKEVLRLQDLLMGQVDKTPIHSINIEPDGAVEIVARPPQWVLQAMAGAFLECLDGAPNWRSYSLGPVPTDGGMLLATVRRMDGETPEETCGKLKDMIESLVGSIEYAISMESTYIFPDGTAQLVDEARALMNPMKKD